MFRMLIGFRFFRIVGPRTCFCGLHDKILRLSRQPVPTFGASLTSRISFLLWLDRQRTDVDNLANGESFTVKLNVIGQKKGLLVFEKLFILGAYTFRGENQLS